jgi:hypothetical protein
VVDGVLRAAAGALSCCAEDGCGSARLLASAFRESMSRTGVEACSLRPASAFATETAALLGAPRRGPMPRASARLLAMDDWGRRRRERARVGDVGAAGGDAGRGGAWSAGGEAVAEADASWCAASGFLVSGLRGGSLMRLACARWLFSRSARMRRDCSRRQRGGPHVQRRSGRTSGLLVQRRPS